MGFIENRFKLFQLYFKIKGNQFKNLSHRFNGSMVLNELFKEILDSPIELSVEKSLDLAS